MFGDAKFELHNWHSSVPELESDDGVTNLSEQTYAKMQMNVQQDETIILGLFWNKSKDMLGVRSPEKEIVCTKRGILPYLAPVYDPLRLVLPVLLLGKLIFREVCDLTIGWDKPLPDCFKKQWVKWKGSLPKSRARLSCSNSAYRLALIWRCKQKWVIFSYVCRDLPKGWNQSKPHWIKFKVVKEGDSLCRDLSWHTTANTLQNTREALAGFPINHVVGWCDSSVVLHWIKDNGKYKQFVKNRVDKICSKKNIVWCHISTTENPADIGSRGCTANELGELQWKGPK